MDGGNNSTLGMLGVARFPRSTSGVQEINLKEFALWNLLGSGLRGSRLEGSVSRIFPEELAILFI